MRFTSTVWIAVVCLAALCLVASCDTLVAYRHRSPGPGTGYGPPAHAHAYGHRNRWIYGHELVYDDASGVYLVVGTTDWYYYDGYFYRFYGDVWQVSLRADFWEPAGCDRLPPGLRMKGRPVIAAGDPGNQPIKLNGNGNSLVKLNGNPDKQRHGRSVAKGRK